MAFCIFCVKNIIINVPLPARDRVPERAELQTGGLLSGAGLPLPGGGAAAGRAGHQVVPGLLPLALAGPPAPPLDAAAHRARLPAGRSRLAGD